MAPRHTLIERSGRIWLARVPGVAGAHTWGRSISQSLTRLDTALSLIGERRPATTRIVLPDPLRGAVAEAKEARARAAAATNDSVAATVGAVRALHMQGYADRDIATLVGVSRRRVQQIRAG
jgi:hypothetical protein